MIHQCKECGKEYSCGSEPCDSPIVFGFCSYKHCEKYYKKHPTEEGERY